MKQLKQLLFLQSIYLAPCAYLSVYRLLVFFGANLPSVWTHGFLGLILPVVFLNCLFLPYILLVVTLIGFIVQFIRKKESITGLKPLEKIALIIMWLICIVGIFSVQTAFHAGMSV